MSPELVGAFERQWPDVSKRLEGLLASKNVPACKRDDVVQETGLRLFGMWEKVDRARPVWPLVVTIALNLLRDEARRNPEREVLGTVPDMPTINDVEHEGLARIEFERVQLALAQLSPSHRNVLLDEIVPHAEVPKEARNATKMMRLRARRALTTLLETAVLRAGYVTFKIRKSLGLNDSLLPMKLGPGESGAASAGALALAALLFGTMQAQPPSVAHASEKPNAATTAPGSISSTLIGTDAGQLHADLTDAVKTMRARALDQRKADDRNAHKRSNRDGDGKGRNKNKTGTDWPAPPPSENSPIEIPLPIGEGYAGGSVGAGSVGAIVGEKEGSSTPACIAGIEPGSLGCGTEAPDKISVEAGARVEANGEEYGAEVDEEIDPSDVT